MIVKECGAIILQKPCVWLESPKYLYYISLTVHPKMNMEISCMNIPPHIGGNSLSAIWKPDFHFWVNYCLRCWSSLLVTKISVVALRHLFSWLPNVLHRSLIVYKVLPWRLLKAAFSFFMLKIKSAVSFNKVQHTYLI